MASNWDCETVSAGAQYPSDRGEPGAPRLQAWALMEPFWTSAGDPAIVRRRWSALRTFGDTRHDTKQRLTDCFLVTRLRHRSFAAASSISSKPAQPIGVRCTPRFLDASGIDIDVSCRRGSDHIEIRSLDNFHFENGEEFQFCCVKNY